LQKIRDRGCIEKQANLVVAEWIPPLNAFIDRHWSNEVIDFAIGTGGNLEALSELKKNLFEESDVQLPHTSRIG